MDFIPTPDGAKLIMPFSSASKAWSNTLWFTKESFVNQDMIDLADMIQSCFYSTLDDLLGSGVTYGPPTVYDMRESDAPVVEGTDDPEGGEATGDLLAPSMCALLTIRTAARGRSARGRMYLAGFCEPSAGTAGLWNSTLTSALEDLGDCIFVGAASIGWNWVIRSIQQDGVILEEAVTRDVTSTEVRSAIPASQRRRNARP